MFVSEIFDEAAEILGTIDQAKVFRKLTQAVQALMESGHWFHTNREVDVCTGWDGVTVTLPRDVEVPLAINIDGSPTYFRGRLFQYHVNKGGVYNTVDWAWDDRGAVATQMDIRQPSQVIAVAESDADVGGTIRIIGTDQWNRDLRSQTQNGVGVDGLTIPIHSISDFAMGSIAPDGNTIATREVAVSPINEFTSATPHQLDSGQGMVLSTVSGTTPTGITDSNQYFVGVVNPTTIQLYNDPLYAQSGQYPISLSSIVGSGTLRLTDSRVASVVTSIELSDTPSISLSVGNPISFSGAILPSPLISGATYFANALDSTNLQIFSTLADAQANKNPIYLTGSTGNFNAYLRKPIAAITKLTFTIPHFYTTGDMVQAYSNGGNLPEPLVSGQNYYVYVIDAKTVTLHTTSQDAQTGTNPICFTTSGSGQNSLNKLIPATAVTGTSNNIQASNVGLLPATGAGATAVANVVGIVNDINVTNQGTGYTTPPAVTFDSTGGTGYVSIPSVSFVGGNPTTVAVYTANIAGGKITSFTQVSGGSGYTSAPTVVIQGGSGFGAAARAIVSGGQVTSLVLDPVGTGCTAHALTNAINNTVTNIVIDNPGTGYQFPPRVIITGVGSNAAATSTITTSFVTSYTITNGGSGYTNAPAVSLSGGGGSGASATAVVEGGVVTAINVVSQGTGYASAPTVTLIPSTGAFVEFASTGVMPSPLITGRSYRAEAPLSSTGFTVVENDFTTVNITSLGSSTFYVVIARSFSVGFTNVWTGDFSATPTGTEIYFASDYLLPTTSPAIDSVTAYYVRRISDTTAQIFNSLVNAQGSGTTGLIQVLALGVGQTYYAIEDDVTATPYNNQLAVSNIQYLADDEIVRFTSTGTLPDPLLAGTDYTIKIVESNLEVYLNGVQVVFTSLGVGRLSLNIVRDFTVSPSTKITFANVFFDTGTEVIPRANSNDTLPTALTAGTPYFTRFISKTEIELYDTLSNSQNTNSTSGRISYRNVGDTTSSTFFLDAVKDLTLVKAVYHVEKPKTEGYVSLYAYDYGRTNDMALIGQYHPDEVNPMYRRVRIGKPCAWARIIYRVRAPKINSLYDYIPVEQERAIIAAVHAVDLEDKDFLEQAQKYWGMALNYLKNQQNSMEGHAFNPPQINNLTYGDGTDPVMF